MTNTTNDRLIQAEQEIIALNATMDNQAARIAQLETVCGAAMNANKVALKALKLAYGCMENISDEERAVIEPAIADLEAVQVEPTDRDSIKIAMSAVLEAKSDLHVASALIGAIVTTSTPIEGSAWPRVSITKEALDDLRKFYDGRLNASIERMDAKRDVLREIMNSEPAGARPLFAVNKAT